jgi:hypoxanthine-guanine phosphoribosyltransferase
MENYTIKINDLTFKILLKEKDIKARIAEISNQINQDSKDKKNTVFVVILNDAFMFIGELMQYIKIPFNISFIQTSSYLGVSFTGEVKKTLNSHHH